MLTAARIKNETADRRKINPKRRYKREDRRRRIERTKTWRRVNRLRNRENRRRWRLDNADKINKQHRAWRNDNAEAIEKRRRKRKAAEWRAKRKVERDEMKASEVAAVAERDAGGIAMNWNNVSR